MTRIVVSYDELFKKYKLVTGNVRANIHTKKTQMMGLTGRSIILDYETPLDFQNALELGLLSGNFRLKIDALDGFEMDITQAESILLNRLFTDSAYLIKSAYESFSSHVKVNMVRRNQEALYLNNLLSDVFPKITAVINEELMNALGRIGSVVRVELSAHTNNSAGVDQYSTEEKHRRNELTNQLINLLKESPYPPQTFPATIGELMGEIEKMSPSQIAPDPQDYKQVLELVEGYRANYRSQLLLGATGNNYQLPPMR